MEMLSFTEFAIQHQKKHQKLFDDVEELKAQTKELKVQTKELKVQTKELIELAQKYELNLENRGDIED